MTGFVYTLLLLLLLVNQMLHGGYVPVPGNYTKEIQLVAAGCIHTAIYMIQQKDTHFHLLYYIVIAI